MDAIKEGMLASAKAAEAAARLGESLFYKTFKFNSQICTSREQSERLLGLGLKKETADMCYSFDSVITQPFIPSDIFRCIVDTDTENKNTIPAWSLHRLLSILPDYIVVNSSSGLNPNFYLNIRDGFVSYKDKRIFLWLYIWEYVRCDYKYDFILNQGRVFPKGVFGGIV